MKIAERIVMVLLLFSLVGGGAWIYFSVQHMERKERAEIDAIVASRSYEIPLKSEGSEFETAPEEWRVVYPNTIPISIGGIALQASVADTLPKRIKGLSDTPFLPDNVVKVFSFGTPGPHSIWMKDMNYAIDILWTDNDGMVVHIEENVSPESYPDAFASPEPAWYVIETNAGFVSRNEIKTGDEMMLQQN